MSAPKMPSQTLDNRTSAIPLSQFRRHFRCSHADQITGPSTDPGLRLSELGLRSTSLRSPSIFTLRCRRLEPGLPRVADELRHGSTDLVGTVLLDEKDSADVGHPC